MRRLIILILFLSLILSWSSIAASSVPGEQELLLFYSNDVLGETAADRVVSWAVCPKKHFSWKKSGDFMRSPH